MKEILVSIKKNTYEQCNIWTMHTAHGPYRILIFSPFIDIYWYTEFYGYSDFF